MSVVALHDGSLQGAPPLLEVREVSVTYLHHEAAYTFNTPKVFVHFKIVEPQEYAGIRIYRAYRVSGFKRKGKGAGFTVRLSSTLYRHYATLTQARERPDRISLRWLKGAVIRATARTVKTDYRQKPLPEACWYSVVDDLLEITAGGPRV